jgi:hypothetical protein
MITQRFKEAESSLDLLTDCLYLVYTDLVIQWRTRYFPVRKIAGTRDLRSTKSRLKLQLPAHRFSLLQPAPFCPRNRQLHQHCSFLL